MTYKQLYGEIRSELGEDASAYCLYLLNRPLPELQIDDNEVSAELLEKHNDAVRKISDGEPIQYVFGFAPFYDLMIDCGPGVLIPRFDTEVLVEEAIKTLPQNAVFADICCGSGCIAAAVLNNIPFFAALPPATIIATGVASPSAQGQLITSTDIPRCSA